MTRWLKWFCAALLVCLPLMLTGCKQEKSAKTDEGTSAQTYAYIPPAEGTKTLFAELSAKRSSGGGIVLSGKLLLPKASKIGLDLIHPASQRLLGQTKVDLSDNGYFESEPFTNRGKPHEPGPYDIRVYSYFTEIWQPPEIIAFVGKDGTLLPASALIANDPEFPDTGRHLSEIRQVTFPPVSADLAAIEAVKNARLLVTGRGRSAGLIKNVVLWFERAGGFEALLWSADQRSDGVWVVTLICNDAGKPTKAQWEYNATTKKVRYLDPLAKLLSYLPPE